MLIYHSYNQPDFGPMRGPETLGNNSTNDKKDDTKTEKKSRPSSASRSRPPSGMSMNAPSNLTVTNSR